MNKRYLEFDIARAIALFLMPLSHIVGSSFISGIITAETYNNNSYILKISSLGVFVFVFMLGVNILLTKHNSPKELVKRGFQTLLLGMCLNIVRYIIPGFLGCIVRQTLSHIYGYIYYSICSDILYFASLCFFFFALVRKLNIKWQTVLVFSVVLNLLDYYLPNPIIDNYLLDAFVGNFIYLNECSMFSFAQWIVVACLGYAFINIYLKQDDKGSLYKKLMLGSFVLLAITLMLCKILNINLLNEIGNQFEDYNLSLTGVLALLSVYLFLQSLVYFASIKVNNEKIKNLFIDFSKGITLYYVLQWIFVTWTCLILALLGFGIDKFFNTLDLHICGILITTVSLAITLLRQRAYNQKSK